MKRILPILIAVVIVLAGGYFFWYLPHSQEASDKASNQTTNEADKDKSAAKNDENSEQYPVETTSSKGDGTKTESTLIKSDSTLESVLGEIFGENNLVSLFNMQGFPQRLAVTVESAENSSLAPRDRWPLQSPESDFLITKIGDQDFIAVENDKRYAPYVALVRNADAQDIVDAYAHFYPLFQTAYLELGVGKYFNDRVIKLIDDILATPDVKGPIKVTRAGEHGKYLFADDQLENLSPAKKLMIRMGRENANLVKSKLRLVRAGLVKLGKRKR